jgi:hypothetical protein
VYLWEESKHKRQKISRNPKTQTEVVLTFSREWRARRTAAIFLRFQKTVYLGKKIHQFFGVLLGRSLFTQQQPTFFLLVYHAAPALRRKDTYRADSVIP